MHVAVGRTTNKFDFTKPDSRIPAELNHYRSQSIANRLELTSKPTEDPLTFANIKSRCDQLKKDHSSLITNPDVLIDAKVKSLTVQELHG